MRIDQLRIVLEVSSEVLDFTTSDGRVFQIAGDRRFAGCYERHFHADSHPTRRNASEQEVSDHFARAVSFTLYRGTGKGRSVTADELQQKVDTFFGVQKS